MKFLALEHELPDAPAEIFQQYSKEEALKAWELHQAGILRELYFRADRNEAVLVLECESVSAAHEVLSCLPFVKNHLIAFEVIPLKAYSGFARLFAANE